MTEHAGTARDPGVSRMSAAPPASAALSVPPAPRASDGPRAPGAPSGGSRASSGGPRASSGGPRASSGGPRDAEQRREQLLRAALDVIVERGYPDTRISDVAERAGTSPALVIYYFKTRDQLLTEAIRYSEDAWYAEYLRRTEHIPDAADRLAELVANECLPGTDNEPRAYWLMWLDLWALSPRSPGAAAIRQKSDERWRAAIRSVVLAGQEAGEFAQVNADDFTVTLAALLDGMTVRIGVDDPEVPPRRAFELAMRFAGGQLGFDWKPVAKRARKRGK